MTPEEREKLDSHFAVYEKDAKAFLKELGARTNEHGVYIYVSTCGNHSINLSLFLSHFKDWLVDKEILNEP